MEYKYKKELTLPYAEAVEKVKDELGKEGFGILTEIDVRETLKNKLDVDMDPYVILGACNPPNAHRSLQAEQDIGLMLPCNVIVYEKDKKTYVSAILPTVAMGMIENADLKDVAHLIEAKLKKAMDAV
ncbi:MAG: DUF302 domain-containing protein [DPANN group archaeon]|nr:DUF302 domain-containing protein [DPANN group archaeon]